MEIFVQPIEKRDLKKENQQLELKQIYVIYGYLRNSKDIEIITAFEFFNQVEPFIQNCFLSPDNPYYKIIWEQTLLHEGE